MTIRCVSRRVISILVLSAALSAARAEPPASPADELIAQLPGEILGVVATNGGDHLKPAFEASAMGKIWHEPSVQAFCKPLKNMFLAEIDKDMDSPQDKEDFDLGIKLARLALSRPTVLAVGQEIAGEPNTVYACLIIDTGPRKAEFGQAIGALEKEADEGEIQTTQIESFVLHTVHTGDDPPVTWTWMGDRFIITVNDVVGNVIKRLAHPTASRPAYLDALAKVPPTNDIVLLYLDLPKIATTLRTLIERDNPQEAKDTLPKIEKIVQVLGLDTVGVFVARCGLAGSDLVERSFLSLSPQENRPALFRAIVPEPAFDPQATSTMIFNVDVAGVYDTAINAIKAAGGDEFADIETALAAFEDSAGFQIRNDLLASLAGPVVIKQYAPGAVPGAPFGGVAMTAGLNKNAAPLEKALNAAGDAIAANSQGQFQNVSQVQQGRTYHVWSVPPLAVMGVSPCWTVVDDKLVFASNQSLCATMLQRATSAPAAPTGRFRELADTLPKNLISLQYTNVRAHIQGQLTMAHQFWPMVAMGVKQNSGIQLPVMLPPVIDIVQHLGDGWSYTWRDDAGMHSYARSPVPTETGAVTIAAASMGTAIALPAVAKARQAARRAVSASNLRQIGLACMMYAEDHEGAFPDTLDSMAEKYLGGTKVRQSPLKPEDFAGPSYVYIPGFTLDTDPRNIIAYENPAYLSEGTNALHGDGHVAWLAPERFMEELKATYDRIGQPMPTITFKPATKKGKGLKNLFGTKSHATTRPH